MNTVAGLRSHVDKLKGRFEYIQSRKEKVEDSQKKLSRNIKRYEMAQVVFQETAQMTQREIESHLGDLVSLAMNAVFDDPYKLAVEFNRRRGKTECDLKFEKDGYRIDPLSSSGYGAVDVATFALRIASWFISGKKSRNILILDEPFKHLKGLEENKRVIEMVKEVSDMMGIQVLMISDERISREDIMAGADRVFEVSKRKRFSKVEVKE